jgi:autotransporter strand-loop-strand O-heptosyltransferase
MSNTNKIIQVTPGNIPIPSNGWGAVEKIIWEYKLQLEKTGYEVEILYTDEVNNSDGIVHVHMANLANILYERGIEYTFSLHDHHVEYFGKDSQCYKDNYEAIKNSKLTFVHSPHLIEYFDNMSNIIYLQHGANLKNYPFIDRRPNGNYRLLMMANNGLGGDPLNDRKGFLLGIDAARKLNLDLTIMCPGTNRQFFEHHIDTLPVGINILYDLNHEEAAEQFTKHDIFLNPSSIEAGHPNLTVTESLVSGIPVVGTSFVEIPGLVRCQNNVDSLIDGITRCIREYDSLVEKAKVNRESLSWDIVVTKMLQHYKNKYSISEKEQLEWQYTNTKLIHREKQEKSGIHVDFKSGRAFLKTSFFSEGVHAVFRDRRTNRILFDSNIGKGPGQWSYIYAPYDRFIDWEVSVNYGVVPMYVKTLNLSGEKVLIRGQINKEILDMFAISSGARLTTTDISLDGFYYDPNADDELFYTTLYPEQVNDYFKNHARSVNKYLLTAESKALGDTIGFIPYAQKWAAEMGIYVDVCVKWPNIFDKSQYPNINIITESAVIGEYTHKYKFEYIFNQSLQKGYSDQFGFEYEEIPAKIKKSGLNRPMKEKYAVIGVQTSAQCKYWNYPGGWEKLCDMLADNGIVPVSVDLHEVFGIEGHWNSLPKNSLIKVGMDFNEVIRWIEHSEIFIGVSSGLSWIAYGLGKKVVMITGTTEEGNEFQKNCTTVSNRTVCNGCFNKSHLNTFNTGDWLWCPEHKGTKRQFECTKTIKPEMVMKVVKENL